MSHGKQFTLFTHIHACQWKVPFVLEMLGLTYEPRYLDWQKGEIKGPEHIKYNPNGRIPTLIDHKNNDFVIWESDAILLYLIEGYDSEYKLSLPTPDGKASITQWLFFQASGQGPTFGQAAYFAGYHSEKLPSVIDRYRNETRRILGVLESVLTKQDWLVGGKLTIADLSFVPWNINLEHFIGDDFSFEKEFPRTFAWHNRMLNVDAVKAIRTRLLAEAKAAKEA